MSAKQARKIRIRNRNSAQREKEREVEIEGSLTTDAITSE